MMNSDGDRTAADNVVDCGADYERAIRLFRDHDGLPANRRSAAEAIARHAAHRHTEVVAVRLDHGRGRIFVDFADGSDAHVEYGYVHHSVDVPGAVASVNLSGCDTWLPVNAQRASAPRVRPVGTAECLCTPGFRQPIGSECPNCGEIVAAPMG